MKAVIFDFDGTLADTLPICFYAFQSVFKTFDNRDLTNSEIVAMFGPSETGIIKENLSSEKIEEAIEMYYTCYQDRHSHYVEDNVEILQLLGDLKSMGFKLGIFTGKARRSLEISLKELKMEAYFDVIITGDDVVQPKPHPEGIFQALKRLEASNEEVIFVGDSDADIQAGISANVFTVGVQWLPNYQSISFSVQPNDSCYNVKSFKNLIEKRF
ncbi:HAD family hydrolase [Ferdinandcohnia quinoae]|uniref:HAD family hydrolase n=1 Tax=Fredinandcohnia quinoae TaxID=2918902 RepID=A0AAW5DZN4_9BACI|nr:HAD family hydrolase [Fredinandcohnia sp. SECRCQ15]MCH1625808.1 HAD family hydrolase [Fredinandcohnia sp. SECRCQ15]